MRRKVRFWIVCDEYTAGPYKSERAAQRAGEAIVRLRACLHPHKIVRASERPVPKAALTREN